MNSLQHEKMKPKIAKVGLVLSSYLVRHELGSNEKLGWYFLDDYAEWLGQAEEHIADLLVLCPNVLDSGDMQLSVVITEAKYITESTLAEKRRESQKQLRDTVRRMRDAVFGSPERLDRELWLSRFSDLLLTGIQYTASDVVDLGHFAAPLEMDDAKLVSAATHTSSSQVLRKRQNARILSKSLIPTVRSKRCIRGLRQGLWSPLTGRTSRRPCYAGPSSKMK